jgi:type IV secretion system protein VirD4
MMLVFQDLGQMQSVYPKARSMIANAAVRIAFGVRDLETAEMLSNMVGATTVRGRSEGQYQNVDDLMAQRRQAGLSEAGRRLLDPAEVLRLTPDEVLLFLPAMAPVKAEKVRYYRRGLMALESRWAGLYDRWRD